MKHVHAYILGYEVTNEAVDVDIHLYVWILQRNATILSSTAFLPYYLLEYRYT